MGVRCATVVLTAVATAALASFPARAQGTRDSISVTLHRFVHEAWPKSENMCSQSPQSIAQSGDGFLWVAAGPCLLRFDGVRFATVMPVDTMAFVSKANPVFPRLYSVDRRGRMWMAYQRGPLLVYDRGRFTRAPGRGTEDQPFVEGVVAGRGDTVYENLADAIGRRTDGDMHILYRARNRSEAISAFRADSDGTLYVGQFNGRARAWRAGDTLELCDSATSRGAVFGISPAGRGITWMQSARRLLQRRGADIRVIFEAGPTDEVRRLIGDGGGGVWLATYQGLWRFDVDGHLVDRIHTEELNNSSIYAMFVDREGALWLSTGYGLERFRRPLFWSATFARGGRRTSFHAATWTGGRMWVTDSSLNAIEFAAETTADEGFQLRARLAVREPLGSGFERIHASRGSIWVARGNRVIRFAGGRARVFTFKSSVWDVLETRDGTVWVAAASGLAILRADSLVVLDRSWSTDASHRLPDRLGLANMLESHDGALWLSAAKAVLRLKDRRIERFAENDGYAVGTASAMLEDSTGTLWVAGPGGLLARIRDGRAITLRLVSRTGGEVTPVALQVDDRGYLWIAGGQTIWRASFAALNAAADSAGRDGQRDTAVPIEGYDASDGVEDMVAPWGMEAIRKMPNGELWFARDRGIIVVNPADLLRRPDPPEAVIEDVASDKQSALSVDSVVTLAPDDGRLQIRFAANSLANPRRIQFRYQLAPGGHDWVEVPSERSVTLAGMAPGRYDLRVQARSANGEWNPRVATLTVIKLPHWYQTAWFRSLVVLTLAALLWGLYQLRIHGLQMQEARLREAIDTMPAMAFTSEADGARSFVNHQWTQYTGLALEQTRGDAWLGAVHPDDLQRVRDEWRAAVTTAEPLAYEVRLRGKDGEYRWFFTRAVPLRDRRGHVAKWYGFASDIEDRKRADHERERLRELEADLAHVNRVSTMGELTASLAHEIRQPIAATIMNANATLRWLDRAEPNVAEAREAAKAIVQDGTRAADIISHLRSLYKKEPTEREPVDANDLIREMQRLLHEEATRHSVATRAELSDDLPLLAANRVQLQQVFMNLMLNGIEAMHDSGGNLIVASRREGGFVSFSITDTGIGLSAEAATQLFKPFFTTKSQGSGMGLTVSQSIVESHGGRIWATPNDGRGTTFHITLPIAANEPRVAAHDDAFSLDRTTAPRQSGDR